MVVAETWYYQMYTILVSTMYIYRHINCNVALTPSEFCELATWEYHIIFFGRKCVIRIVELLCK
jgi:hypothetical protein